MIVERIETPENWQMLPYHAMSLMFPEATETEYDLIVESMKKTGFHANDPIILVEVEEELQILDGRTRHLAAQDAGVEPLFMLFDNDDVLGFVCSRNIDRRHLTAGQKAALGAEIANLDFGQNPSLEGDIRVEDAAKMTGSSEASIKRFRTIAGRSPELGQAVKRGEETLNSAWEKIKKVAEPGGGNGQKPAEAKPLPASLTPDPDEPKGSEAYQGSGAPEPATTGDGTDPQPEAQPEPAEERPWMPPTISVTIDRGPFKQREQREAPVVIQVGKNLFRLNKQAAAHMGSVLLDCVDRLSEN